jgi:NADPH2:quinone reductase
VFPPYSTVGPAKTPTSFLDAGPVAAELADLVDLVASGAFPVETGWRGPLERFDDDDGVTGRGG